MTSIFKIRAEIHIHDTAGENWYTISGYSPKFVFGNDLQIVGYIDLLDKEKLKGGDRAIVEVSFASDVSLEAIQIDSEFGFYELSVEIGKGKVTQVIGWVDQA